jgi:hypothetical protein
MKLSICILFLSGVAAIAQTAPVKTVNSECPWISGQRAPFFRGGYCFINDRVALRVYAPNGDFAFASVPRLPGTDTADVVEVADVAVDPGAGFVIAVWSRTAKGLLLLDQNGMQTKFIPTNGFTPAHVAVSEDHSIGVGGDFGYNPSDHMLVYKYSNTGRELGSYLPFSSFPAGTIGPIMPGSDTTILVGGGIVVVTARSGLGSNGTTKLRELIRMDYSGNILTRTRLDNVREQAIVLTADGVLYRCDNVANHTEPVSRFSSVDAQSWQPVPKPGMISVLFGSDQSDLVYRIPNNSEKVTLQWFSQP